MRGSRTSISLGKESLEKLRFIKALLGADTWDDFAEILYRELVVRMIKLELEEIRRRFFPEDTIR